MPELSIPPELIPHLPDRREMLLALIALVIGLSVAAFVRQLTHPGRWLSQRVLPEEHRVPVHRWSTRFAVFCTLFVASDVAGFLPVKEGAAIFRASMRFELATLSGRSVTPTSVVVFLAILLATRRVSDLVQSAVATFMRRRGDADDGVIAALQRLAHYLVMVVGLTIGLQTIGFDLTTLLAASTVLGVGIAFGLQTIAENFVAGLILLFETSIRPGDMVTLDGDVVRVKVMGIRATRCQTLNDEELIVPNARLVTSQVINHSTPSPTVRARCLVGVAYESDVDLVLKVLAEAARSVKGRVASREPVVLLKDFGASSIDFEISIWVQNAFARPPMLSALRVAVWRALHEHDITIAFPQLDVHFDTDLVDAVRRPPPT